MPPYRGASGRLWILFFREELQYRVPQIMAFFVPCVWLVPFGFFVSVSLGDTGMGHHRPCALPSHVTRLVWIQHAAVVGSAYVASVNKSRERRWWPWGHSRLVWGAIMRAMRHV